jgi:ABC-type multidrug transport system fused ATPase/permease subunit
MKLEGEPTAFMLRRFWKFSKGNRHNVVIYAIMFVIANSISFLSPLVVGWLLDTIQTEGVTAANIHKILLICSLFIVLQAAFWAFHGPARVIERKNAFYVRAQYKKYLIDGTLDLPAEWHASHHSGNTIDKIEKASSAMYSFSNVTYEIIETLIRFLSSFIVLMYFNLSSGFIIAFVVIIAITVVIQYDKKLRVMYKEIFKAENAISQKVYDIIGNITTVIVLRIEKFASSQIWQKIMAPYQLYCRNVRKNEAKWAIVSLMTAFMTSFVLIAYFLKAINLKEAVLVGTVYILYGYVERINSLFFRFAYRYSDFAQWKSQIENAEELSDAFRIKEDKKEVTIRDWKKLNIKNLTFGYNSESDREEELHLKNLSLTIKKKEKIALVGESGSGKTTFLKLLRGLYTPKHVEIRLDGQPIENFDVLDKNITLIPQEPELFTSTIRENITMGLDYSDEAVKKYTDIACFTKVIEQLPHKLDSFIHEKGVNLSGGEKQRLALARGLLACEDKPIILLDEPTSSVDSKNEIQIYKNIRKEFKDATIISSVHRLHMLDLFDTIYVFKRGKIVASGNLKQLRKNSPEFRQMWKKYHEKRKKDRAN